MEYFGRVILLPIISILFGCEGGYKREIGCHLDKMSVSGNVVKIETIVQSSMPLTEVYANAFDPRSALSTYAGNISIEFDNHGNAKRHIGYGIDGKKIFDESNLLLVNEGSMAPGVPIGPGANQQIDKIRAVSSKEGKVVNIKYYDGDNLVWNQRATYNNDGSVSEIVKEYGSMKSIFSQLSIPNADTTTFNYLAYDEMNNWIEAEVLYKGRLPKFAHSYKIKRQITYFEEEVKPSLIEKLDEYNQMENHSTTSTNPIRLGDYGLIMVPHYMAPQSDSAINALQSYQKQNFGVQLDYLFMSEYNKKDAYATISVTLTHGNDTEGFDNLSQEELKYDEEFDKLLEEQNTQIMAQGGTYVLKWLPYEFTSISGKRAMRTRCYRYGNSSPIPVYCENILIPTGDGNSISLFYSFQSNLDYRFRDDFTNAINSIHFDK